MQMHRSACEACAVEQVVSACDRWSMHYIYTVGRVQRQGVACRGVQQGGERTFGSVSILAARSTSVRDAARLSMRAANGGGLPSRP